MIYRIPKFEEMHTNAELTKRGDGQWFWVRFPTSLDSLTLRRLMKSPEGMMALGAYTILVEIAANGRPRGYLTHRGKPLTMDDIGDLTGMPGDSLKTALTLLQSPGIAWIEGVDSIPDPIPIHSRSDPDAIDQNSTSNSLLLTPDSSGGAGGVSDAFDQFWNAYPPPKSGKGKARKAWTNAVDLPPIDAVLRTLDGLKRSQRWKAEGGKWIPSPASWLESEGWHDQADAAAVPAEPDAERRRAEERERDRQRELAGRVTGEERKAMLAGAKAQLAGAGGNQ